MSDGLFVYSSSVAFSFLFVLGFVCIKFVVLLPEKLNEKV